MVGTWGGLNHLNQYHLGPSSMESSPDGKYCIECFKLGCFYKPLQFHHILGCRVPKDPHRKPPVKI